MSSQNPYRDSVVGVDIEVPVASGERVVYANLDNAASTPALKVVRDEANLLMDWYASVHRGAGYKSQVVSEWYEQCRDEILEFVGADPDYHCVIFCHNTTDAMNRLSRKFPRDNDKSVIISHLEHHANDLPWRDRGRVVRVKVSDEGDINLNDLEHTLMNEGNRARLVSLTGASNVVGTVQPIHEFARIAHKHGVPVCIDAAQLAPHKPVKMVDGDVRIDFMTFSGHKMYAPYGGGALIGPKHFFNETTPAVRGGGAVLVVEPDGVDWAGAPEREEAGSPNVLGMVTMASAIRELKKIGFDELDRIEQELTLRFLKGLNEIDGVHVHGHTDETMIDKRLGVIAFGIEGLDHELIASVLAHEGGIGVRNGCFCAHPFVLQVMNVCPTDAENLRQQMRHGDKTAVPGAVRVSFGLYNTPEEVDRTLAILREMKQGKYVDRYQLVPGGKIVPREGVPDYGAAVKKLIGS